MSESLYVIEQTLQDLIDLREAAETEGDNEAVAVVDGQLAEYLSRESVKIDSYAGLIHQISAERDECKAESDRLAARAKAMDNRVEEIKARALEAMQRFGVKKLNTPRNTLRIQGNGGLQPLDAEWPKDASGRYELLPESDPRAASGLFVKKFYALDTDRIREALKRGESVPGAKLLPRGEHLRCE